MRTPTTVDELFSLYYERGDEHYGERVTQLSHALQCAALATLEGASDALIIATLFHDVGHLVDDRQRDPNFQLDVEDDNHEAIGGRVLATLFGPRVAQPVALHVTAKRWRVAREPDYLHALSSTSQATLLAQGGPLSETQCLRFEDHPGFSDAVTLRRWDDTGKVDGGSEGTLEDYRALATRLASAW